MLSNIWKIQKSPQKENIHNPFIWREFLSSDCFLLLDYLYNYNIIIIYIIIYYSNSDFITIFAYQSLFANCSIFKNLYIMNFFHSIQYLQQHNFYCYLVFHLYFPENCFQIYWQSCASIFFFPFSILWPVQISAFSFLNLFICIYFLLFLLDYVEAI